LKVSYQNKHADILERCKNGEQKAYYEIYKLYSRAMLNICFRIVGDQELAEDVLQEAFVSAFQNLKDYQGKASFGAWLKRIVVNRAISYLSKNRLEVVIMDEKIDIEDDDTGLDEDELVLKVETIRSAIQKLPNGFRVVFSLYLLEGYDHKEIAEILKISESTSKSQYNRAKKKLKEILKEEIYYE
jgi:RNA polymerase sigma factor (sigma-70 family)